MKMFKKIAALALSAVMAAGLMATPAMAINRAGDDAAGVTIDKGSITVMNVAPGANPYTAYRLFDLSVIPADEDNTDSVPTYTYIISMGSPWFGFFYRGAGKNYVELLEGDWGTYLVQPKDSFTDETAAELAGKALAYSKTIDWDAYDNTVSDTDVSTELGNGGISMLGLNVSTGITISRPSIVWKYSLEVMSQGESAVDLSGYTASDTGCIAQNADVIPGYYLVDSSMGSLCAMDSTDLNAVIYEKNEKPTIKKEVMDNEGNWGSANDAGIGDTVKFRVEVNPQGLLGGQGQAPEWDTFTVTYTDGVNGDTVFPDQSYEGLKNGDSTPAFVGTPSRDGYTFVGWNPTPTPTVDPSMADVDGEIIYTATWAKTITVTYTDGVNGATVFPDQSYEGLKDGDSTPAFVGTPTQDGYTFMGWAPAVKSTVDPAMANEDGEIIYTATWESGGETPAAYAGVPEAGNTASTGTGAQITGLEQSGGSNTGSGSGVSSNSTLSIRDTVSDGLTLNDYAEVWLVGEDNNETYLESVSLNVNGNSFTYTFTQTVDPPKKIVLYYSATVNSDAVIGGTGNTNTVELLIGDKPSSESKTTTYVHKMDLVKVNRDNEILSGAEFELYNESGFQLAVEYWDHTDDGRTVYRVTGTVSNIRGTDMDDGVLSLLKSDEKENIIVAGNVVIEGLGAGTYHLRETKAPEGYNRAGDQYFTVVPNKANGSSDGTMTLTIGVQTNVSADAVVNDDQYISGGMAILNLSGAELPSTGGIGTTIFYVVGGLLVVGAVVLLVVKKRMSDQ